MINFSIMNPITEVPTIDLDKIARMYLGSIKIASGLPNIEFIQPESLPNFESEKLSLSLKAKAPWKLSFGSKIHDISDVILDISLISKEKQQKEINGTLKGNLRIGSDIIPISCNILSEMMSLKGTIPKIGLSLLIQELCGIEAMRSLKMPIGIHAIELSYLSVNLDPQGGLLSLSGKSDLGDAEVVINNADDECHFLVGFKPSESWKLSQLYGNIADCNDLPFSNILLIVSSSDISYPSGTKLALNLIKPEKKNIKIAKGLNLIASINPSDINVDKVLGLKNPQDIAAYISESFKDIDFQTNIEGIFYLDKNLAMSGINLHLLPTRKDFSCVLSGVIEAKVGPQQLKFMGTMEVGKESYTFKTSNEITWSEPLDIKAIDICNLTLNIIKDYKKNLQTVEITGNLHLGNLIIPAAIPFDSASWKTILAKIDKISIINFLPVFCDKDRESYLAKYLTENELNVEFTDADIIIASEEVKLSKTSYKKGLQICGNIFLQGMNGDGRLEIVYADRMELNASLEKINLADAFALSSSTDLPRLHILIDGKNKLDPTGEVTGTISLLGISSNTQIQMTKGLFQFNIHDKLFNSFQASLQGQAFDFASLDKIFIMADLEKDFYDYLQENAASIVSQATNKAVLRIRDSEKTVADSKAKVKDISEKGIKLREEFEKKKAREAKYSEEASRDQMDAQSKVNEIKDRINSLDRNIDELERNLDKKWRVIENAPWEEQLWRQMEYADDARKGKSQITELYKEIGDLEIANWNAFQDLERAKLVLRSICNIDNALPIDFDPEINANSILFEAESKSLETAITATDIIKQSFGPNLDLALHIANLKSSELLKVTRAHFQGNLDALSSGKVNMSVDVQIASNPSQTFQLNFDFNDPLAGARSLAQMLLPVSS